jgi:hypothetical protein
VSGGATTHCPTRFPETLFGSQRRGYRYLGIIEESLRTDPEVVTSHYREAVERLRAFRGGPLLPAALIGQAGILVSRD